MKKYTNPEVAFHVIAPADVITLSILGFIGIGSFGDNEEEQDDMDI